jgi:hypothetical protein
MHSVVLAWLLLLVYSVEGIGVSVINVDMSHLHGAACQAYNTNSIQEMQYTRLFGTLWCRSFALVTFLKC